jgi:hypothetical protein
MARSQVVGLASTAYTAGMSKLDQNKVLIAALRFAMARVAAKLPAMVRTALAPGRRARLTVIEGEKA